MNAPSAVRQRSGNSTARDGWIFLSFASGCAVAFALLVTFGKPKGDKDPASVFALVSVCGGVVMIAGAALKFLSAFKQGARAKSQIIGLVFSVCPAALIVVWSVGKFLIGPASIRAGIAAIPTAIFLAFLMILPFYAWRGAQRLIIGVGVAFALFWFVVVATIFEFRMSGYDGRRMFWAEQIPEQVRPGFAAISKPVVPFIEHYGYRGWYPVDEIQRTAMSPTLLPMSGWAWNGWAVRDREAMLQGALSLPPDSPTNLTNPARERRAGYYIGRFANPEQIRQRLTGTYTAWITEGVLQGIRNRPDSNAPKFLPDVAKCMALYPATSAVWEEGWIVLESDLTMRDAFVLEHLRGTSPKSAAIVKRLSRYHLRECGDVLRTALLASEHLELRIAGLSQLHNWQTLTKAEWRKIYSIAAGNPPGTDEERAAAATLLVKLGISPKYIEFQYWDSIGFPRPIDELIRDVLEQAGAKIDALPE